MATIVFSHGFGVKADSRGMFTDIAAALPQHDFVMVNLNTLHENGDVEVEPLSEQAARLQKAIYDQAGTVIVVAHSQGCVIAGLVDLEKVSKAILVAPPVEMSMQRAIDKLMKRPGSEIDLAGMSKLPRTDGTTTLMPSEYIQSVNDVEPLDLYAKISEAVETTIVRCLNDEVLGVTDVNTVPGAKHIDIEANHDFTGDARDKLISIIDSELR